jgi:hypothetical protein
MARLNSIFAALAAASLAFSQPAAAAARASAPIGESESAAKGPGGEFVVGLLLLIGAVFVIMAITDDNDPPSRPTSP